MKHIHKWILRINNAAMWVCGICFIGYKLTDLDLFHSLLLISTPVFLACGIYFIIREIIIARSIKAFIKKFWLELFYFLMIVLMMVTIVIGVSLK